MKATTLLLVDDHTVVRQGLRAILANHPDLEIVGEADNGAVAVAMARKLQPDVVLMDIAMPSLNGLDATRRILKEAPSTKVLVLTSYGDDECVSRLLQAGATGYLVKHTAANELPQAIREVRRGNSFFSPAIAKHVRNQAHATFGKHQSHGANGALTERELQVLKLIAQGFSNKEAACELGISIKTIEKHRQQVMNKINIHETAGLTRYALTRGIVPKASAEEMAVAEPQLIPHG